MGEFHDYGAEELVDELQEANDSLSARLADAESRNEELRYRLAEIIGYCGRPGRDGEPYDTIQALARGEITLRGGGKATPDSGDERNDI